MLRPKFSVCAHGAMIMPAKAGEVLFFEGDPCEQVFELRRGIARGISISEEGERQVTAFFFAGDQIGLPITDSYRYSAEAVTDLGYVSLSRQSWSEALVRSCREDGKLLPSICSEQDPVFRRGIIIGRNGVLVRVSAFLILMIDRLIADRDGVLEFPVPQVDIAAYLATSPESVCRALKQLKDEAIIAMPDREHLAVLDRAALVRIANGN